MGIGEDSGVGESVDAGTSIGKHASVTVGKAEVASIGKIAMGGKFQTLIRMRIATESEKKCK